MPPPDSTSVVDEAKSAPAPLPRIVRPLVEHRVLQSFLRRPGLAALIAYGLLGLLANYPSWPGDPSRLATCVCGGNEDPAQTAWFLAWTPFALLHGHNVLTSAWINLPTGADLAQNTSMPLLGLLTAPLTLLVSPLASENLLRWLAFPLSAYAMYWVLAHFVRWLPAAFLGGLLYGFSPYMVGQASVHLNLSFVPLPPLILYTCFELVVTQRRGALRTGAVLGALALAQFFISAEILATTALTAALACVLVALVGMPLVPRHIGHCLAGLGIAALLLAVGIAYPVHLMTSGPLHYVGPAQGAKEIYNADLLGPILPTVAQLVAPHRLAAIGTGLVGGRADIDENGSYLGVPLIMLLVGLVARYRRRRWIPFSFAMAVVMFAFSLGPSLTIDGKPHKVPIRLPFSYLQHIPLVNDVLPARFSLYVALFASVVVALGLDAFHDGVRAPRWHEQPAGARRAVLRTATVAWRIAAVTTLGAAALSLLPRWPYVSHPSAVPSVASDRALASVPAGGAVLTYPYATPYTDQAMLWQALDAMRFKIFGSYILRPGVHRAASELPAELSPLDVQAMLSNTLSPVGLPGLPYLAPTTRTIVAQRIVVAPTLTPASELGTAAVSGVVENVNLATGSFFLFTPRLDLVGVTLTATTIFDELRPRSPLLRVTRAEHVTVYGNAIAGTINPHRVADLRTFLRVHHVDAVVVQGGIVASRQVALWVTDAIGAPNVKRASGDTWLDVPRLLARTRRRPGLARATSGKHGARARTPL